MPEYPEICHVLVVGAGPVAVGPACRALRAVGLRVALVDPHPATITVDPEFTDAVYAAPITAAGLAGVIAAERPDGLLVALAGPDAVRGALTLRDQGVLRRYGTVLLGADSLTYQDIPAAERFVDVVSLHDRHGRAVVVDTVEHIGGLAVAPSPSQDVRHAVTDFGPGCGTVRFVHDGNRWRISGSTTGLTRSSVLAAAARGIPLAETVALLSIGANLTEVVHSRPIPARPPSQDRVELKLGVPPGRGPSCAEPTEPAESAQPSEQAQPLVSAGSSEPAQPLVSAQSAGSARSAESALAAKSARPSGPVLVEESVLAESALLADAGLPTDSVLPRAGDALVAVGESIGMGSTLLAALNAVGELPPLPETPAWLMAELRRLDQVRAAIERSPVLGVDALRAATAAGLADDRIAALRPELSGGAGVRRVRERLDLLPRPVVRSVPGGRATEPGVLILGPAPGDPAECAHACRNGALALRRAGHRVAITGLVDGLSADRVYVAPPRVSDVLAVVRAEERAGPFAGVITQWGGPGARTLGRELASTGVRVIGPADPTETVDEHELLCGAVELDVVALCDGHEVVVCGVGELVEPDGWVFPASVGPHTLAALRDRVHELATGPGALGVRCAVLPDRVVVRSVTVGVPTHLAMVSALAGVEFAQAAARLLLGASIPGLRREGLLPAVGPGPERVAARLVEGVMGLGGTVGAAYAEARTAAGRPLPTGGTMLVSVDEHRWRDVVAPARELATLGFRVVAAPAVATVLRRHGVDCVGGHAADLVIADGAAAAVIAEAVAAQRNSEPGMPPSRVPRRMASVPATGPR